MAMIVTDNCINCGACEPERPNNTTYEDGQEWSYAEGATLKGKVVLPSGAEVDTDEMIQAVSDDYYSIVADKYTECIGFHDAPQCATVCPINCCVPDGNHQETEEGLYARKRFIHSEE